jgi:outer membrane immunogenic protein
MEADIARPVYKAPPAGALPVAYDWTGFYIGGHDRLRAGAKKEWTDSFGLSTSRGTPKWASSAVDRPASTTDRDSTCRTAEGDFSWTGIKGGNNIVGIVPPLAGTFNTERELDLDAHRPSRLRVRSAGSSTARAVWPGRTTSSRPTPTRSPAASSDRHAHRLDRGRGVEYAFAPAWSAKLEYNYMDFGDKAFRSRRERPTDIDQQIHAVKLGVNYKFGFPGADCRY